MNVIARNLKNLVIPAAILGLGLLGSAVNAQTVSFTSTVVGPFNTDFGLGAGAHPSEAATLGLFDTSLGTLTSIDFTVSGTVDTTFTVQDLSGNPNTVTLTSQGTVTLYGAGAVPPAGQLVFTTPVNTLTQVLAANGSFGPQLVTATGTQSLLGFVGNFLPYEALGGGIFTLPVSANGQSSASDTNGNISSVIRTQASVTATVVYHYTNVPEPGTVAMLMGMGVSGSAFLVRRRRRA